jgi:methionine-rich copper-binding protein CopC
MTARPLAPRRVALVALLAACALALMSGPALAHDELVAASPQAGATLGRAPGTVVAQLERGVTSASAEVSDGCGRALPVRVTVAGSRLTAVLTTPPPPGGGTWLVRWRVIGTDGHLIIHDVPFSVRGEAGCDGAPAARAALTEAGHLAAGHLPAPAPAGAGLPVVPLAAGAAALALWAGSRIRRPRDRDRS